MFQQQLNITLKKIFKINNMKKTVNETITQKINSNDEYCIVNNKTKLQKVIDAALNKTKQINFEIKKFRCSLTFHSDCIKVIFRSNLKYD